MRFLRWTRPRQDRYWRNRERDIAMSRLREAMFFLFVMMIALAVASRFVKW